MPVRSPKQCRKRPLGAPPFATMAISSSSLATSHRLAAQPPATCAWNDPVATRRRMCWSVGAEWQPCRGKRLAAAYCLVAPASLPLAGSCRDTRGVAASLLGMPWVAFPARFSCRGLVFFPASSSCRGLGWPSRQAPPTACQLSSRSENNFRPLIKYYFGHAAGACKCVWAQNGQRTELGEPGRMQV